MKVKKLLIVILIFAMTIPVISYAINTGNENKEFLTCQAQDVSKGDKIVLNLNLDLIQYENFEFTLTSNTNLDNISTETEEVDVSHSETNEIKITGNKSELNINQIDLHYQVPEEIEIGSNIELIGLVKSNIIEDEVQGEELEQKVKITLTVVENQEDKEPVEELKTEQNIQTDNKTNNQQIKSEQNSVTKTTNVQMQTKPSNSLAGNVETNTYNGESNNYLSSLEISNYNINPEFTKTNTTYFIEVPNDCTEVDINAEAEDTNAEVNVYGNSDLQQGENKILVFVTAENGEVKIYRIYVTREFEK